MEMCDLSVTSEEMQPFPFVNKWHARMAADEAIGKHDKEMKETLAKTKKTMPTD
jgi:hypothetical protein